MSQKTSNLMPKIKLMWVRGRGKIQFNRPHTYTNLGLRGSGKSALLEALAIRFDKIIDLFGSRDSEGLAWCRSPFKDSILFIIGDSVEISSEWPYKKVSELTLSDLNDYKVILSVSAFYGNLDEEFDALNHILYNVLYRRIQWSKVWFLMVREASNFIYSRIKISRNQSVAKNDFIYLLREARHMGYAVGADTIRWTSIDKEIRDVSDYIFIKRVGVQGLPRDLRFIYGYVNPISMMNPKPHQFVLLSSRGPIAIGLFSKPPWHKEEKENLFKKLNIQIKYGEVPQVGIGIQLSDWDHAEIIKTYVDTGKVSETERLCGRARGTIYRHVKKHNLSIKRKGFCERCRRVKGAYTEQVILTRGVAKGSLAHLPSAATSSKPKPRIGAKNDVNFTLARNVKPETE